MVPPAPTRFSITIGCPSSIARRSNTRRGNTSAALPAPNGITALIGRDGQLSARAANGNSITTTANDRETILFMTCSGLPCDGCYIVEPCKFRSGSFHQRELQQQRALD